MTPEELQFIAENLDRLENESASIPWQDAELLILGTLTPLLREDGFFVRSTARGRDKGVDYIASKPATEGLGGVTIGIEYKHRRQAITAEVVRAAVGAALLESTDCSSLLTPGFRSKRGISLRVSCQ